MQLNIWARESFLLQLKEGTISIVNVDANIDRQSVELLKKMKVDKRFKNFEPEDLAVSTSGITARKPIVQN